jgi:HK97 family phage major capsid protein
MNTKENQTNNVVAKDATNEQTVIVRQSDLEAMLHSVKEQFDRERRESRKSFNLTGEQKEKRLESLQTKSLFYKSLLYRDFQTLADISDSRAKALNEGNNSQGGFLVPQEFEADVIRYNNDYGKIRANSTILVMTAAVRKLNELVSEPTVEIVGEAAAITDSTPTFAEPVLTAKKYVGSVIRSVEIDEDAEINLERFLAERLGIAFAEKEQNEFINGTTSGSEGLRQVSGVSTVVMPNGNTNGQGINWDHLRDMISKAQSVNLEDAEKGKFYMHSDVWGQLEKSKAAGDGNYFNNVSNAPIAGIPRMAWGHEVVLVNQMPGLVGLTASTKFVMFANLKNHAYIGERTGMRIDVLTEGTVNNTNLAGTVQMAIRAYKRTAFTTALKSGIVWLVTSAS